MRFDPQAIKGRSIAVVGCGSHPVGLGLGKRIDACGLVLRANRAFKVGGIERDYGSRTDLVALGHLAVMFPEVPNPRPFPVCPLGGGRWMLNDRQVEAERRWGIDWDMPVSEWRNSWTYPTAPLTGTFLAVMAAHYGAASLLLVGLDLYADGGTSPFKGYVNRPAHNSGPRLANDAEALAGLGRKTPTEWVRP